MFEDTIQCAKHNLISTKTMTSCISIIISRHKFASIHWTKTEKFLHWHFYSIAFSFPLKIQCTPLSIEEKRLRITAHNIFAWFYLWIFAIKIFNLSIFFNPRICQHPKAIKLMCSLAHDTLQCACLAVSHTSISILLQSNIASRYIISIRWML